MWAAQHCSMLFSSGQNRLCVFCCVHYEPQCIHCYCYQLHVNNSDYVRVVGLFATFIYIVHGQRLGMFMYVLNILDENYNEKQIQLLYYAKRRYESGCIMGCMLDRYHGIVIASWDACSNVDR